jgi:heme iron utilization protein
MKLATLLQQTSTAALATLHAGEPAVSMVPYALMPNSAMLVIHVSQLASHTQDMRSHPGVSLLVTAPAGSAETALALPRVSVQGLARPCVPEMKDYTAARGVYLSRFPESEELFSFTDFSLFVIEVQSARFVAGFGSAISLSPDQFAEQMRDR